MVLRPDWRTFAAHSRTWHRNCWCNAQAPRRPNWTTVCAWTRGARCWHEARGPYEIVEYSAKVLVAPSRMPEQLPAMGLQCFGRNGIPHLLGPSPQVAAMAVPTVHQIIQCHAAWVALSAVPAHAVHQPCDHFARWRVRALACSHAPGPGFAAQNRLRSKTKGHSFCPIPNPSDSTARPPYPSATTAATGQARRYSEGVHA